MGWTGDRDGDGVGARLEDPALRVLGRRARRGLRRPERRLTGTQRRARIEFLRCLRSGELRTVSSECLCGIGEDRGLLDADRYGLPSPSVVCLRCGLVRTTPHLDEQSLTEFYRHHYRALYTGSAVPTEAFWSAQVEAGEAIHEFLDRSGAPPFALVADVGCGAGGVLEAFRRRGAEVHGCDLGADYLAAGRSRGLDLREGGTEALRTAAPFDLMILSHVLEHAVDPIALLRDEVRPLLRPGGWIYIELPGVLSIGATYGDPLQYFQNAHLWNFTAATLGWTVARAGFRRVAGDEVIRAAYRIADDGPDGEAPLPDGVASQVLAAVSTAAREHARIRRRVPRVARRWVRRAIDLIGASTR